MNHQKLWQDETFRAAFLRWWDYDWSWNGLADKKHWEHDKPIPMQSLWRDEASNLLDFGGRSWTAFHLPPFDSSGNVCPPDLWAIKLARVSELRRHLYGVAEDKKSASERRDRSTLRSHLTLAGVVFPDDFAHCAESEICSVSAVLSSAIFLGRVRWRGTVAADFSGTLFLEGADFRGAELTGLTAADRSDAESVNFVDAIFAYYADFRQAKFPSGANFAHAIFGDANFRNVSFSAFTCFQETKFSGDAYFSDACFLLASFASTVFLGTAQFWNTSFSNMTTFANVKITGTANFRNATFHSTSNFHNSKFMREANFREATFSRDVTFSEAVFAAESNFQGSTFSANVDSERATFRGKAQFDDATFLQNVSIERTAFLNSVDFSGVKPFARGMRARGAFFLRDVDFSNRKFEAATDFSDTEFHVGPRFFGAILHSDTSFSGARFRAWADPRNSWFRSRPEQSSTPKAQMAIWLEERRRWKVRLYRARFLLPNLSGLNRRVTFPVPFGLRLPGMETVRSCHDRRTEECEIAYRNLRRLSAVNGNIEHENLFFGLEHDARRGRTDVRLSERILSLLYKFSSDYGNALLRPVLWLLGFWAVFVGLYIARMMPPYNIRIIKYSDTGDFINCRQNFHPVLSEIVGAVGRQFVPNLFGAGTGANPPPEWVNCAAAAHPIFYFGLGLAQFLALVTTAALFLIALRRRFQVKE